MGGQAQGRGRRSVEKNLIHRKCARGDAPPEGESQVRPHAGVRRFGFLSRLFAKNAGTLSLETPLPDTLSRGVDSRVIAGESGLRSPSG